MNDLETAKCRRLFSTLVHCQSALAAKDIPSSAYIREFFETEQCDKIQDFAPFRKQLSRIINNDDPQRLSRVLAFTEDNIDEKVCAQACIHYNKWHKWQLVNSLSWQDWFVYHTIDRSQRILISFVKFGSSSFRSIEKP